jgi:hypothetical protein
MKNLVSLLVVVMLVGCGQSAEEKQIAALKQQNQQLLQQEQLQAQQRQQEQYQQAPQVQPQAQYQQPMQQAPAPIIVQSAPAQVSGSGSSLVEGMALGAVAGHLLSGGNNNNSRYNPPQTVINKTYVNKTYEAPRTYQRPATNFSAARSTISSARRR